MPKLTLEQADAIANAALKAGHAAQAKPLTIAILDDGGHLKLLKREDRSTMFRCEIAIGKAWGAVAMGAPSRMIAQFSQQNPNFVASLNVASGGKFIPNPGGVLILDPTSGEVIGSVGVSGGSPDEDEAFAIAGVKSASLNPVPAEPAPIQSR
jgi:uncharacterized protein GlcG (DUF336 family)